jgi:hypothetical protein
MEKSPAGMMENAGGLSPCFPCVHGRLVKSVQTD